MRRYAFFSLIALGSLFLAACSSSREAQPSDAEPTSMEAELVAQSIQAQGGRAQFEAIESMEMSGSVAMPTMGMTLPLKIYQKRPGMMRSEVIVEQMGATVISAYDGETGWTINPMQGSRPQKVPDSQLQLMKEQADIDGILVGYADKGYELDYQGEAKVREANAHKLRVLRPDSSEIMIFLDAETYLPIKQEAEGPNPMSGAMTPMETYITDYRDVNGVKMPFQLEVVMNGQVFQRIKVDEITVNPELEDSIFAFPGTTKSAE